MENEDENIMPLIYRSPIDLLEKNPNLAAKYALAKEIASTNVLSASHTVEKVHPSEDPLEGVKVTTITGYEIPKISMPIDPDILSKYDFIKVKEKCKIIGEKK